MDFTWDAKKAAANRKKHGLSFETAAWVFEDPGALSYVDEIVDREERWHTIGLAGGITVILVVHTVEVEDDEETIRIISARKASRRERALWEAAQEGSEE